MLAFLGKHVRPIVCVAFGAVIASYVAAVAVARADEDVKKSAASVRAARRLFDGAPPVIPHAVDSAACNSCHNTDGVEVPGLGFAPPNPHAITHGVGLTARCRQCHVEQAVDAPWRASVFEGLEQDLRSGRRLGPLAPPVIPHPVFMRENCVACHTGTAAREEIRTSHPERARCQQCHVERVTTASFAAEPQSGSVEPRD